MDDVIQDLKSGVQIDIVMDNMRRIYKTEGSLSNKISLIRKKILNDLEVLDLQELSVYSNYEDINKLLSSTTRYEQAHFFQKCCKNKDIPQNIKSLLQKYEILPKYLSDFKISQKEQNILTLKKRQSLQTKLETVVHISDIDNMIRKSIRFIETADERTSVTKICCCLLLLTGRRISEIVYTAEFTKHDETEYAAHFEGQLKKRDEKNTQYAIPLLAPLDVILIGLSFLRKRDTSVTSNANKDVKKMFSEIHHIHVLRSVYIKAVFCKFLCQSSFPALAKACLGHEHFTESLHYSSVVLDVKEKLNFRIKILNGMLKFE